MNQIVGKSFFKIFLIHFVIFSLFAGFPVSAQVCPLGEICIENPLEADSIEELIAKVIDFIFTVALLLAPLMIIIAGLYFITAAGDPTQIGTAKKIILYTLVGFFIILIAKGLIELFKQIFEVRGTP